MITGAKSKSGVAIRPRRLLKVTTTLGSRARIQKRNESGKSVLYTSLSGNVIKSIIESNSIGTVTCTNSDTLKMNPSIPLSYMRIPSQLLYFHYTM